MRKNRKSTKILKFTDRKADISGLYVRRREGERGL
jgi:hypothetical protein